MKTVTVVVTANDPNQSSQPTKAVSEGPGVVVVTVTATDPAATTASDGGVVVVYVTETASTTDQSGHPTNVMVTITEQVHVSIVAGVTLTAYSTADDRGSLQSVGAAFPINDVSYGIVMAFSMGMFSVLVTALHLLWQ